METRRLSVVFPHTRVASLVKILRTTAHGAFPVVSLLGSEGESESLVSFENHKVSVNDDDDDDDDGDETADGAFPVVSLLGSEGESESLVSF